MREFGSRFREVRRSHGVSLRAMEGYVGMSRQGISLVELGKSASMRGGVLLLACYAMKVSRRELAELASLAGCGAQVVRLLEAGLYYGVVPEEHPNPDAHDA